MFVCIKSKKNHNSVISFIVDSAMSTIMLNVWDAWMQKLVNILKKVKSNDTSAANHLIFWNQSAINDDFSILTRENKKF